MRIEALADVAFSGGRTPWTMLRALADRAAAAAPGTAPSRR
jgi:hypothetical protein